MIEATPKKRLAAQLPTMTLQAPGELIVPVNTPIPVTWLNISGWLCDGVSKNVGDVQARLLIGVEGLPAEMHTSYVIPGVEALASCE